MIAALIFIIVIGVLIFVHELGHFVMAKRAGMKVEEFGFGFPPRLFGIKRGETIYSLNWIPFGGFVRILGENGEEKNDPRSFASKKPGVKSKVIIAGVVMNVLFAVVLLSVGNILGLRTGIAENVSNASDIRIQVIQVAPDSPAQIAGLSPLDQIMGFRAGEESLQIQNIDEIQEYIKENLDSEVIIILRRGNKLIETSIIPRKDHPPDEGPLGISLATTGIIKYPWYQSIYRGVSQTAMLTGAIAVGYGTIIKNIFTTGKPGVDLSGPIGIAVFTGRAAQIGFTYLLQFTALVSINLAILNIIPFPALDGGRLLFIGIEKARGKPVSNRTEGLINAAGFALLILLMIYVTTKDIVNLF